MTTPFEIINLPAAYLLLAIFSLVIGSLLNVIIYRLPQMIEAEIHNDFLEITKANKSNQKKISLFLPRSFCPACKNTISARFNIPLLSYFLLRGRCASCDMPISLRYPLVELLSCLLALLAAWHFGFN